MLDDEDAVADCAHHWRLDELKLTLAGASRGYVCIHCGASTYQAAVAEMGDTRPPLDYSLDDLKRDGLI